VDVLIENLDKIWGGFQLTLKLLGASALVAMVLGALLAAMRVSPVPVLRWAGTSYVNIFRNTPLVVLFLLMTQGVPQVINASFFKLAVAALGLYTAAFICEALRSGVNAVPVGQAEAARAVGMTFGRPCATS
jgi:glutamate transport system permease protein